MTELMVRRGRGRPPRSHSDGHVTRSVIVRRGTEMMTETGFFSTSIDQLLTTAGIPKGSFYHYFSSKEDFGLAVVENYADYFGRKLSRLFENTGRAPLIRLADFVAEAAAGMERYAFQRGCLLGNLGQEVTLLSPEMREKITATLRDWEDRLLVLLQEARASGELKAGLNIEDSAACFWTGWEGAVLVARLRRSSRPMENFFTIYLGTLQSLFKLQTEGP